MAQIDTYIKPAVSVAAKFARLETVVAHVRRRIGNWLSAHLSAPHPPARPSAESSLLWDHGMTRRDLSAMLDHLHGRPKS